MRAGAFGTAGQAVGGPASLPFGISLPQLGGFRPNWGWEAAIGFDWKPQAYDPWHVSAQFRYGQARKSKPYAAHVAGTGNLSGFPFNFATGAPFAAGSARANQDLREDHWLVDFAVGRDFGLGASKAQWKLGVRVADLRAKLTANGNLAVEGICFCTGLGPVTTSTVVGVHEHFSPEQQQSKFLGVGPRFGVEGETPLGGNWTFDWQGGVAVLFGDRKLDRTFTGTATAFQVGGPQNVLIAATITSTQNSSSSAAVFNPDGQAGLSYWFTPNVKLTASYRVDAYFKALRTLDATGNIVNADRIYHGPMLRLTTKF